MDKKSGQLLLAVVKSDIFTQKPIKVAQIVSSLRSAIKGANPQKILQRHMG